MQLNNSKNIAKIIEEFNKINKFSKSLMRYGVFASFLILLTGGAIIVLNKSFFNYDVYMDFIGTIIVKNSMIILAEAIIGGLLIDFFTKKS